MHGALAHLTLAFLLPLPQWRKYGPNPLAWMNSVYFRPGPAQPPPFDLSVARHRGRAGNWLMAVEEYERVAEWHPTEVDVWVGWMEAASHLPESADACTAVLARGLNSLKSPSAAESLYAAYVKATESAPAGP